MTAAFVPLLARVQGARSFPRRAPLRMCTSIGGRDVVVRTARLAHLRVSEEEIDRLVPDFQRMLGFVDKMNALQLADQPEVSASASPVENVLRKDEPRPFAHV